MTDIFISHSSSDEQVANKICMDFEKAGFSCWIAPRDIQAGKEYGGEILKGIEKSQVFFLCLSKSANESQHVLREVERAVNRKLPIIVYQHEETQLSKSLEYFLASTQWFIPGERNGMDELIGIVGKLKGKKSATKSDTVETTEAKKKSKKWIWSLIAIAVICMTILGTVFLGGTRKETEDKVFLLSVDEVEKYFMQQNLMLAAIPTDGAVMIEGTGLYKEYNEQGESGAFWGLRTQGENACSIVCAGSGFGKTEDFHSEYACSSLIGIRPAIVLPLEYVEKLE